ncbi:MAG: ABC transporter permease [Christensenellaceae bacterium]|jgi:ribose transport system permease protein
MEKKEQKTMLRSSSNERRQQITLIAIILAVCVLWAIASPSFLTIQNFTNIIHQMSVLCIMSYGMTVVLISGGVDLSMGFMIAFSGIVCAMIIQNGPEGDHDGNIALAIAAGILSGSVVGFINGAVVARLGLPPYIATLAMQMCLRGMSYLLPGLGPVYLSQDVAFRNIAQTRIGDVLPLPFIYAIVLGLLLWFFLRKTVLGRRFFAIGSNGEAARLSGINLASTRTWAYIVASTFAAIAGVVHCARINAGMQTSGQGMEGDGVVASVMGGTSMAGGHGTLFGCFIGSFFMTLLKNGLNLLKINTNWQFILIGLCLVISVWIDKIRRERAMSTLSE